MELRAAEISDIDDIVEIVSGARAFLKLNGVDQWQDGYPEKSVFEQDIRNGNCFVAAENGRAVGVICVIVGEEPGYNLIEDGSWLTENSVYAVFHRFAVQETYRGRGLATRLLSFAESLARGKNAKSLRGDTHRGNKSMRGLLEKCGYTSCGTVYVECEPGRDSRRLAYEKILTD